MIGEAIFALITTAMVLLAYKNRPLRTYRVADVLGTAAWVFAICLVGYTFSFWSLGK
jgi:hypothetical protein